MRARARALARTNSLSLSLSRSLARSLQDILRPNGFANVTVPYRENRAVLFDSALFHNTDGFRFAAGYTKRRINLTILYGHMDRGSAAADPPQQCANAGTC